MKFLKKGECIRGKVVAIDLLSFSFQLQTGKVEKIHLDLKLAVELSLLSVEGYDGDIEITMEKSGPVVTKI